MRISRDQDGKDHQEKALWEPGLVNKENLYSIPGRAARAGRSMKETNQSTGEC